MIPDISGFYWIREGEIADGPPFVLGYLNLNGDRLSGGMPVVWLWTPQDQTPDKPTEWSLCWDGECWISIGDTYTDLEPQSWHPILSPHLDQAVEC